jgi:hypothetical protein
VPRGGATATTPVLNDGGLRGDYGLEHWTNAYGVQVAPLTNAAPCARRPWLRAARQGVATPLASLTDSCGLKYPGAPSAWGLLMRVVAKVEAYNVGIMINRLLGRPDFAFATLIV